MNNIEVSLIMFKLFKKKRLLIDKHAFLHSLKSHPEYPQLIAISNTLDYFNIEHGIYQADSIHEVGDSNKFFIAPFKNNNGNTRLALVECENRLYKINSINSSVDTIEKYWSNIALILGENKKLKKKWIKKIALKFIIISLTSLLLIFTSSFNLFILGFYLLSIFGIILSIFSLKDIFNFHSSIQEKICKISKVLDCKAVISSKKWKLFKLLDFADLSFVFFLSQLILLIIASIFNTSTLFFKLQYLILLISPLFIIPSLYYQKFVVRHWCPLCLGIMGVLILEFIYISLVYENLNIVIRSHFYFILFNIVVFFIVHFIWKFSKNLLIINKEFINKDITRNRLLNNYNTFKIILKNGKRFDTEHDFINLNKYEKHLNFTLITDPFCEHCKDLSEKLNILSNKSQKNISWDIIFNIDINDETDLDKSIYRNMMNIQLYGSKGKMEKAIEEWYQISNEGKWLEKYHETTINLNKIDDILRKQHQWCVKSEINHTPALLIYGYMIPNIYSIDDIVLFIDELLEDKDSYS